LLAESDPPSVLPFTGEERWFDAKPATVRIKARALKKLKDAAA
jgi:hypothetical protein